MAAVDGDASDAGAAAAVAQDSAVNAPDGGSVEYVPDTGSNDEYPDEGRQG